MSQHDMNISNQSSASGRSDLNSALAALATLSSGVAEPATMFENMLWYDTANKILKMRTAANDGWISLFYLDQTAGKFRMLENIQIVDTSGTQKGLLGPQTEATWKAGSGTLESLISPAKLKAVIAALGLGTPSVSAGNVPSWGRNDDTVYDGFSGGAQFAEAYAFPPLNCTGTVRLFLEFNCTTAYLGSVRWKVNGTVVYTATGDGWATITTDVTVSPGDVITIEAKGNTTAGGIGQIRSPQIRTATATLGIVSAFQHPENQIYI